MPKLGLEMEQGTVLEWYVEPGDDVSEGDTLVEVESEKSIGEVDAREDGTLRQLYVGEQESVPPGTPIGILAAPEADISTLEADVEAELGDDAPEIESSGGDAGSAEATSEAGGDEAGAVDGAGESPAAAAEAVKASPRARERADELGVDLTTVEGTGFEGAITEDDVEAATESDDDGATEAVKASPRARERADELGVDLTTVEGTGFEGAITEDDVEAAAEVAAEAGTQDEGGVRWVAAEDRAVDRYGRVTTVADPAAGEALFETMDAVRAAFEERVTMTDVLLVVVSAALGAQPEMNGTYAESTHQIQETQDVALVGSVDDDAVASVVPELAGLSLTEIVERRRSIDGDADAGAEGATFTLANAAETETEGRLINPPAVAALAVDPTSQRATPDGDGVDLQPLVTLDLTYDTRALGVDDARAFLNTVCERAKGASELVLHSYSGTE